VGRESPVALVVVFALDAVVLGARKSSLFLSHDAATIKPTATAPIASAIVNLLRPRGAPSC
jgi:hypothetical protein